MPKGYQFTFPFLDDSCELNINEHFVSPLYKHCINAKHPTMAVIGYVFTSAITQMIDIQVSIPLDVLIHLHHFHKNTSVMSYFIYF